MWFTLCFVFLCLGCGAALLVTGFLVWSSRYWKATGFESLPATFFWKEFFRSLLVTKSNADADLAVYRYFSGRKIGGLIDITGPNLWIMDPDLMRNVFVKDFDHFVDRQTFDFGEESVYGNLVLVNLTGKMWKDVRNIITPTFTSGKIKRIFELVQGSTYQLNDYLAKKCKLGEEVEMKDAYGRFTMDVIASSAFGVDCNSFQDPDATFPKMADRMLNPGAFGFLIFIVNLLFPRTMNFLRRMYVPLPNLEESLYDVADVVKDTIAEREKHGIVRRDFLQMLLAARKGKLEEEETDHDADSHQDSPSKTVLTEPMLIAQCIIFFLAGYESTSNALSFAAYELALNPDIQEKLYEEVKRVVDEHDGQITYDGILEMEFLDKVLSESLRLHTPSPRIDRKCTKDYHIPGTDMVIHKGTSVTFPTLGIHQDERYYPNPTKFDPERFSIEEKAKRNPYVYQPFGHGPRNCIGMRFALMEVKAALAKTVLTFKLHPSKKTDIPMKYAFAVMVMRARNGVWLRLEERNVDY